MRPLSVSEVDEVFQLRLTLEPAAVALRRARLAKPTNIATPRRNRCAPSNARARGALARRTSAISTAAFHLALIVPRGQPVTHEILQRLHTLFAALRAHAPAAGRAHAARDPRAQRAVRNAWAKGDARGARRLTQRHIEETRDELAAVLA